MANLSKIIEINDLRRLAKKRLPKAFFETLDHGSEDDVALHNNISYLSQVKLVPRVVRDVSKRDASTSLFGVRHSMPLAIAPTGIAGWGAYRGEIALARAAARAEVPFTLSGVAATRLEEVAAQGGTQWYHVLLWKDWDATLQVIDRVEKAGFQTLVITVDSTVPYNRPYDARNGLSFPMKIRLSHLAETIKHPRWTFGTAAKYIFKDGHLPRFANIPSTTAEAAKGFKSFPVKEDALDWSLIRRIRDRWPRNLIIKGIMHPDDAILAVDSGADGVVVSNHGGGVLDSAPSTIEILPEVVSAVGHRATVLIDSGFRRGSDIVKAVALGADAVLVGRATFFGE